MEEKYIDLEGLTRYDQLLKSKIGLEVDAGHEYVEIGGVKWATMNVGANNITDTGLYFQWGDTQGYTADQAGSGSGKKYFGWADYKYGNGTSSPGAAGMTKYNSTDGKTVLDASDDAVTAAWGSNWRMPTKDEYVALGNAVNTTWTDDYQGSGVKGLVCTDKTDSSKTLFFPACGYCHNGSVNFVGGRDYYWSSSLSSSNVEYAYQPYFVNGGVYWQGTDNRCNGSSVRGIYTGPDKVLGTTILDSERTKWNNAVEDINNKADISSVYTKSEIDAMIGIINTELSNI